MKFEAVRLQSNFSNGRHECDHFQYANQLATQQIPHQTMFVASCRLHISGSRIEIFFFCWSRSFFIMAPSPSSSVRVIYAIDGYEIFASPLNDSISVNTQCDRILYLMHIVAPSPPNNQLKPKRTQQQFEEKKKQLRLSYLKSRSANRKEYLRVLLIHNGLV